MAFFPLNLFQLIYIDSMHITFPKIYFILR